MSVSLAGAWLWIRGRLGVVPGSSPPPPPPPAGRVVAGGIWEVPVRAGTWSLAVPAINQFLKPFFNGEDLTYTFTGTAAADPTTWAVSFALLPQGASEPVVVSSPAITRVVTPVGGGFQCVFSVPLTAAQTAPSAMAPGAAAFVLWRTDTGGKEVLASGGPDAGGSQTGGVEVLAPIVGL